MDRRDVAVQRKEALIYDCIDCSQSTIKVINPRLKVGFLGTARVLIFVRIQRLDGGTGPPALRNISAGKQTCLRQAGALTSGVEMPKENPQCQWGFFVYAN
jgi:hypothetical protein